MSIYLVSYRITNRAMDRSHLSTRIREISQLTLQILTESWIIGHVGNSATIRDVLRRFLQEGDQLLVVKVTNKDAAWSGLSEADSQWVMQHLS